jgi:hypothetical protein
MVEKYRSEKLADKLKKKQMIRFDLNGFKKEQGVRWSNSLTTRRF